MAVDQLILGIPLASLLAFIVEIVLTVTIARLIYLFVLTRLARGLSPNMSQQVARVVQYGIIIIGVYIGLWVILMLDFSTLLISLGILGIAVAFAAQQVMGNFLAGIIISLTRQVQVDDWVDVGGSPTTGLSKVKEITLMNTILVDREGRVLYVPNSLLLTNKLVNYTRGEFTAIDITLWVPSLEHFDRIGELVYEEADRHPLILPGYEEKVRTHRRRWTVPGLRSLLERTDQERLDPSIEIAEVQATKVRLMIRVWTGQANKKETILTELLLALKKRLDEEGIPLANA